MAIDTDDLDSAFAKSKGTGATGTGLEALPNGEYSFVVKECQIKDKGKHLILARKIMVIGGEHDGAEVQADLFLKHDGEIKEFAIDQTKKEFRLLGFDVDLWTKENGRPFSKELAKACIAIKGVQFVGKKTSSEPNDKGKVYHNLYVEARKPGDGKPEKFGEAELATAVKSDIPF